MTKTYETYKDSGIAWIGQIPSGWKIDKGKHVLSVLSKQVLDTDEVITCFRDGEVVLRSERRTEGFTMSDKEIGYQHIDKGDLVIHGMDGFAGSMGISKSTGKGSPVLIVCNPIKDNADYLMYYLRILASTNVFLSLSTGIRERSCDLKWNKISVLPFTIPPITEQASIATFLDTKCSEIDSLISLQEEMISELQAYKQSVITEAVTKGLNPNVPMKDSGVEWIGEIPEKWIVKPFKSIYITTKGLNITKADLVEKGIPVLSYGQIHSKENPGTQINDLLFRFVPDTYITTAPDCLVQKGCFLIADTSEDREGCGNAIYVDRDMKLFAGYHTIIAKPIIEGDNKYLAYLFLTNNWRHQIRSKVSGIKVFSVNQKYIRATSVILPPKSEQIQIVDYLDEKTAQIDSLISIKQEKIQELKDYKKSIIYEYVTGKKRV